jgi:hypothetical protein
MTIVKDSTIPVKSKCLIPNVGMFSLPPPLLPPPRPPPSPIKNNENIMNVMMFSLFWVIHNNSGTPKKIQTKPNPCKVLCFYGNYYGKTGNPGHMPTRQ